MNHYFLHSILFCVFVNTQNIVAQSVIESKYENGQIETRYHLRQNDTFCIENFRRNGVLESKSWRNDSVFRMESNQIIHKEYGQPKKAKGLSPILELVGSSPDFEGFKDSVLEYYPNRQCKFKSYYVHNKRFTYNHYLSNGVLYEVTQYTKNADNTFQTLHKKQDIEQIGVLDTAQQVYTLTFKQRNQIRQRNIYQWIPQKAYYDFPMITQIVYNSTENQMAVWHRDSVLHPDKNNNLCLYGMRNAADEWVIPPQYESISSIHYGDYNNIDKLNTYYIVNQGDKRGIINSKGEIVVPIEWDGLNDLRDTYAEPKEPLFRDMLNWEQPYSKTRFTCFKNKLCGVINVFNEIILKPIYQSVDGFKNNLFKIEVKERHGIVDQSGQIIVEPKYYDLEFTKYDDLFILIDTFFDANGNQKKGLINRFGKILLPCQFENVAEDDAYHRCFFTYLKEEQKQGIFHAERGWLLDTSIYINGFTMRNPVKNYDLVHQKGKDSKRKIDTILYGVVAAPNAEILLPFEYQQVKCFEIKEYHLNNGITEPYPYFLCQKNGKYGIFDPMRRVWKLPLKYDDLHFLGDSLFLGLADGKWWAINGQQQSLLAESVDDLLFSNEKPAFNLYDFYIQKKDTLYRYDQQSFPYLTYFARAFYNHRIKQFFNWRGTPVIAHINGRILVSTENHILLNGGDFQTITDFVKMDGAMVQRDLVFQEHDYFIVQNKKTKLQQIIDIQGNTKLFLPQYEIQSFQSGWNTALVADKTTGLLGMVAAHLDMNKADGTMILPCQFFALTRVDARGIIWGKKDFPMFSEIKIGKMDTKPIIYGQKEEVELPKNGVRTKRNTLSALDTRWQMYDKTGQLLSTVPFDYPFEWQNRLGIGQVAGKQGLWNAQGNVILPAQYDRIFYDEYSKMFHLFQFQSDGQQKVAFANADGQLIISDDLKNMSYFYGEGAFVETREGYGVIQKNGQYLVKPAPFALQQSTISLIDTLLMVQKKDYNRLDILAPYEGMRHEQSPAEQQWATFVAKKQKIQVGNLMMEQVLPRYFINGQHIWWQRQNNLFFCKKNPFFISKEAVPLETVKRTKVIEVVATEQWISLKLRASDYVKQDQKFHYSGEYPNKPFFKNIELKNNIWKEIGINDILIWNAATQKALNQLLFDKIGALKKERMDCGNPEKYWKKVQNQFYILFEGLQFYMPRSNDWEETIPILLTWAELKPFLKE